MNKNSKILLIIAIIICIIGTSLATYLVMDFIKTSEINSIESDYDNKIDQLVDTVVNLQLRVFSLEDNVTYLDKQINTTLQKWEETNISLEENLSEIEKLRTGDKFNMHNPTYAEVASFIAADKTDETPFDSDTFDCENYALEVNNNAKEQGIRCALVVMYFEGTDTGHAIVGFETVDRGMVYVEPQTDDWVENFEIGNDYWTGCIVPGGHYIYTEDPNDTIREILIYW